MASSSDEGEIIEDGGQHLKAPALQSTEKSSVDRQDRTLSRHSSPDDESASRYSSNSRRSRSPRGYKRNHDDYDSRDRRRDYDGRRSRPNHDDARRGDQVKRSRVSYDDLDSHGGRGPEASRGGRRDRYNDRDTDFYDDRPRRQRSRSPYRPRREERKDDDRRAPNHSSTRRDDRNTTASSRTQALQTSKDGAKQNKGVAFTDYTTNSDSDKRCVSHEAALQGHSCTDYFLREPIKPAEPDLTDVEPPKEFDEDAEIERRRKRREELLAKSSSATPLLLHAVGVAAEKNRAASPASSSLPGTPQMTHSELDTPQTPRSSKTSKLLQTGTNADQTDIASPRSPGSHSAFSPGNIDLTDDRRMMNTHGDAEEDGPSAADYDPTVDMQEDERRDELRNGQVVLHGESHPIETTETITAGNTDSAAKPADEGDDDDDFDMFGEDFDEDKYLKPTTAPDEDTAGNAKGGILEGDDKDGYYKMRIGEVLDGRYQIQSTLGRGMFSGVVGAIDIVTKQPIAIKMIRNNDALRKSGYTEIAILEKLNDADPESRKHIIKFVRSFDFRGHLCMAFENLSMNLREVLKKFGNNVGINLSATRTYAYQIFVALAHMQKCSIIHADLKPDNILVNESRNVVKICDLGTAIDKSDAATAQAQITPYLISRFYRAPEIILGIPYDYGVDMWSIGCTLYELYTGKILFAGDSNNQMLKAIMEIRGRFTPKLYKRGQLSATHFDEQGHFVSVERDKVLGKVRFT